MQEMTYFIPNETYDNAIKNEEKGVLKALLIGIIGSDPTFSTTEYDEATAYIKDKSEKMNGSALNLLEVYSKQEDEYEKEQEKWDEEYYQMLLVWYRDNYATERLTNIRTVGKEVYRNKPTLGKTKRNNRLSSSKQTIHRNSENVNSQKKDPVVIATGNDVRKTRLTFGAWFKQNWKWVAAIATTMTIIIAFICLFSNK